MKYSKPTPPDYEKILNDRWPENANLVVSELKQQEKGLVKRIETFLKRFPKFQKKDVEKKIKSDEMFRAWFAKDPKKQNLYEQIARDWLEKHIGLKVEILPKKNKDSLYVTTDGKIESLGDEDFKSSKSLDLRWNYNGIDFFAMHKYTHESGGAQGGAFKEMQDILNNFNTAKNKSKVLIVIVDGKFYNEKRMKELKNLEKRTDPQSYVVHIEDVPEIMKNYKKGTKK